MVPTHGVATKGARILNLVYYESTREIPCFGIHGLLFFPDESIDISARLDSRVKRVKKSTSTLQGVPDCGWGAVCSSTLDMNTHETLWFVRWKDIIDKRVICAGKIPGGRSLHLILVTMLLVPICYTYIYIQIFLLFYFTTSNLKKTICTCSFQQRSKC